MLAVFQLMFVPTCVGLLREVVLPKPKPPFVFLPQVHNVPSALTAKLADSFADTDCQVVKVPICTGELLDPLLTLIPN
jgi:hypothetical protein